jgi:hypothetical protein
MDAMKSSHDEIALQGIEFWSNVCDEEYELQLLQQEVKKKKPNIKFQSKFFLIFRLKNKIVNPNEQVVIMLVVHYHI